VWLVLILTAPMAVVAVFGGLLLLGGAFEVRNNAGSAMRPTLLVDEYFLVDCDAHIDGRKPRRGDVVVFVPPESAAWLGSRKVNIVKRIVGLPGEQVEMRKGVPIIDGRPAVQEPAGEVTDATGVGAKLLRERFADGTTFEIMKFTRDGLRDDGGPFTVPRDAYFVLGDNRDDSIDSRAGVGSPWWFVPAKNLIGSAEVILWSGVERFGRMGMAVK
jgi:signal peptidase I